MGPDGHPVNKIQCIIKKMRIYLLLQHLKLNFGLLIGYPFYSFQHFPNFVDHLKKMAVNLPDLIGIMGHLRYLKISFSHTLHLLYQHIKRIQDFFAEPYNRRKYCQQTKSSNNANPLHQCRKRLQQFFIGF